MVCPFPLASFCSFYFRKHSGTQTSIKRRVGVIDCALVIGCVDASTGVRPCGANCSTIRDLRRDRHRMWHRLIECTKNMLALTKYLHVIETYPCTLSQAVKTKLVGNLSGVHCVLNPSVLGFSTVLTGTHTGKSCLLAKTNRRASLNSSSLSMRCNSSRASTTRSLSLLSTTKMIPWVFWK